MFHEVCELELRKVSTSKRALWSLRATTLITLGNIQFPISGPLQLSSYMSLSCTVDETLSLVSQNLRSRNTSHILFVRIGYNAFTGTVTPAMYQSAHEI